MNRTGNNSRRAALALLLVFASLVCAVISISALLLLGPGLLAFLVLSLGHYPGEQAIERLTRWFSGRRLSASVKSEAAPQPLNLAAKAGRAIAYALAMRPPPHSSYCRN